MKDSQKGFVSLLLLLVIVVAVIGGGVYVYEQNKSTSSQDPNTEVTSSDINATTNVQENTEPKLQESTTSKLASNTSIIKSSVPLKVSSLVQQLINLINQKFRSMETTGILDVSLYDELENRLPKLSANEILSIIDGIQLTDLATVVNLNDDDLGKVQSELSIMDTIASYLQKNSTSQDVIFVDTKFEHASTNKESAKWGRVLETMAYEGNQSGYIQILNNLSGSVGLTDQVPNSAHESAKYHAELIGRVLGYIGTKPVINALLLAAADNTNEARFFAAISASGYLQDKDTVAKLQKFSENYIKTKAPMYAQ